MHLYLIRHAQSQNNASPESRRVEDPHITPIGVQQAEALAERLRGQRIDVLLTSAFRRALQTMQAICRARNQTSVIWTDLHEKGGCYRGHIAGQLEGRPGMTRSEIESNFPEFDVPEDIDEYGWWKSKPHESISSASQRAQSQARRLVDEFGRTNLSVACVIHADFKALMLDHILEDHPGPPVADELKNTGITELRYRNDRFEVVSFNDVSHLKAELVSE